ncbi:MAG: hypothetical protein OEV60_02320 [Actinomycetota bacterium]|nr:hypothetical protein [Actinomycetota bacterium]MDH5223956.1 hypothetical protein [Actinomycetota bacterium]MDH5313290.1 hypothetical protein [Actinomycetota bacterium]
MDPHETTVNLGLPADPGSIGVLRAVVASVASRMALTYEGVDDLRIAAAEAAALVLSSAPEGSQLCVDLLPSDEELRLTIWVEGAGGSATIEERGSLAWRVIEGLTDDSAVTDVHGSPAIELRLRTIRA